MSPREPSFRIARVVYFTDLTRADCKIIPLGALAEVFMSHVHGLALKARQKLTDDELSLISPLLREKLLCPFDFLKTEFDEAWDQCAAGNAIDFLAQRHSSSLSVLAPRDCVEKKWAISRVIFPREEAVEAKLSSAVDNEFAAVCRQYDSDLLPERKVIESIRQAA